jgi:hypothetical protein
MRKRAKKTNSQQQLAWNTMRELKTFTGEELIREANLKDEFVEKSLRFFLYDLNTNGYLSLNEDYPKHISFMNRKYTLIKNTGALSPTFTRKNRVYDKNIEDFVIKLEKLPNQSELEKSLFNQTKIQIGNILIFDKVYFDDKVYFNVMVELEENEFELLSHDELTKLLEKSS